MRCPTCKKAVNAPTPGEPMGAFPFCSDRCKLIDLGRWLDGKYQIPVAEEDDDAAPAESPEFPPDAGPDPDSNGGTRRRSRPSSPN
ncbi:MAG TPA: DNA gyrase inhibitor YacG [Ramlibacter sp.]|nr:DNA gyrase inhibitor YacG [Ramlibacter sp.]